MAKVAVRFGCTKQSKNLERCLVLMYILQRLFSGLRKYSLSFTTLIEVVLGRLVIQTLQKIKRNKFKKNVQII